MPFYRRNLPHLQFNGGEYFVTFRLAGSMPVKLILELQRSGSFWQTENFDRLIRNEDELEAYILYTLNNPVKANLVRNWKNWPFSYCKSDFSESL